LQVKNLILGLLCCVAVILAGDAKADDPKRLQNDLRKMYEHKLLSLRNPYFGDKLEFDSSGTLIRQAVAGPWSTCGLLHVENLVITPHRLEIDGRRAILVLRNRELDKHSPLLPSDVGVVVLATDDRVRILIESAASDVSQVNKALSQVFQGGQLLDRVAAYWQPKTLDLNAFRHSTPNAIVAELEGRRPVYFANSSEVSTPKPIRTPDPSYTDIAQRKRFEGTAVLLVVVNEKGLPEVLEVTRPLGEGLDIQAVAAVAHWTFKPAMKDGQPVAVLINVEVKFRLR
jgi:TonB family protein